jgi:hypothetical protein
MSVASVFIALAAIEFIVNSATQVDTKYTYHNRTIFHIIQTLKLTR